MSGYIADLLRFVITPWWHAVMLKPSARVTGVIGDLLWRVGAAHDALRADGRKGLRITSGTDSTHRDGSLHYQGKALDVTPIEGGDAVSIRAAVSALSAQSLHVVNEYEHPSADSTAGHLHVEWRG